VIDYVIICDSGDLGDFSGKARRINGCMDLSGDKVDIYT
jgi:hypothetical protein